jgi:hypothetical protein
MCREVDDPELELVLFVQTRWGLMSACLDRALRLQLVRTYTPWAMQDGVLIHTQAVTCFTLLVDSSEDVPPLWKKKYRSFLLSKLEWEQLKLLQKLMKVSRHCDFPPTRQMLSAEC